MRENNRKPIEKCIKKLPQFTTMNVIDGQAGLVIYSSLIFYSLTIDNILNIIVLLILAGVSIAMLTGENGILTQANTSKKKTEEAEDIEKIRLAISEAQMGEDGYQELTTQNLGSALIKDGVKSVVSDNEDGTRHILLLDEKKEYKLDSSGNIENLNIDFDSKYVAPTSQDDERNNGVIGIGTDGQTVDMDLWEYTPLDDETYGLNDENVFIEDYVASSGYSNDNLVDGKIQGAIPQYIKASDNSEFIPVTNINYLFYNTSLSEAPTIPCTVTSMRATFNSCSSLTSMPVIPNGVTNMYGTFATCAKLTGITKLPNSIIDMTGTFQGCSSLIEAPEIPNSVENMERTFYECTSLTIAPVIPNSVINMHGTFENCTALITPPTNIPEKVKTLAFTFYNCTNLKGEIEINASINGSMTENEVVDYHECFYNACKNGKLTILNSSKTPIEMLNKLKDSNENIIIQ